MSVDYYQRIVNGLDKEIADLEKKQASADKKAADEKKKAASVTISKNASASTIKSKMNQIARYNDASNKATSESADLAKKIADKRKKRNDAYLKLQKEQQNEQKKQDNGRDLPRASLRLFGGENGAGSDKHRQKRPSGDYRRGRKSRNSLPFLQKKISVRQGTSAKASGADINSRKN